MIAALAARSTDLAAPTRQELEAITPFDRWHLEDRLREMRRALREFNDEELRRWVEIEGASYRDIARVIPRSKFEISQRCARLDLTPEDSPGGGPVWPKTEADPAGPCPSCGFWRLTKRTPDLAEAA